MSQPHPNRESKLKWLVPATLLCLTWLTWWTQQERRADDVSSADNGLAKIYLTRTGSQPDTSLDADQLDTGGTPFTSVIRKETVADNHTIKSDIDTLTEASDQTHAGEDRVSDSLVAAPSLVDNVAATSPLEAAPTSIDERVSSAAVETALADDASIVTTDNPTGIDQVDIANAATVEANADSQAGEVVDDNQAHAGLESKMTTAKLAEPAMATQRDEREGISLPQPREDDNRAAQSLAIAGRLFSPGGKPATGMHIQAMPVIALSPSVMWTTDTDANGDYRLSGLQPGRYRLETKSFAFDAVPTVFFAWAGSNAVDITLVASGGAIRNNSGSAYAASAVDDQGRVIAPAVPQKDEQVTVEAATISQPIPVVGDIAVRGSVISPLLQPVAGAKVQLSSVATHSVHITRTSASGTFSLKNIVTGDDYRLQIIGPDNEQYLREHIRVTENQAPIEVVLAGPRVGQLSGHVLDTRNQPVQDLTLIVTSSNAGGRSYEVTTGETGKFSLNNVPAGDIIFISHSMPGLRARGLTLRPGAQAHVYLVVDKGEHALTGVVRNQEGEALEHSEVTLRWQTTRDGVTSYVVHTAKTDHRGRYLFTGLGDGKHTLSARATGAGQSVQVINVAALNDDFNVDLSP